MIVTLAFWVAAVTSSAMGVPPKLLSGTITSADYPRGALERHAQGTTRVRLTIMTDGSAADCTLHQSSGDAELDARVCPLVRMRMRFSPALDHDGKPMAVPAILPVRWELEPLSSATATPQE